MEDMTDDELNELNISRELWNYWREIMNALWQSLAAIDPANTKNDGENGIVVKSFKGQYWKVHCNFVNKKFLQVEAELEGETILQIRFTNNPYVIQRIVTYLIYSV